MHSNKSVQEKTERDAGGAPVISPEVDAFARLVAEIELFMATHGTWPEDLGDLDAWRAIAAAQLGRLEIRPDQFVYAARLFARHRMNFALQRVFRRCHDRAPHDSAELWSWVEASRSWLDREDFLPEDYAAAAALCSERGLRALAAVPAGQA
jgi:hypothetical protein